MGAIGIGPRGQYDLGFVLAEPDVRFVAICDVRASRRQAIKAMADAKYGSQDCAAYRDLRELLARPDIDAVLIATGDRWAAPASILAAKAGKDIYCEKPCAISIALCQVVDDTMRRYGRVFSAGTQRRTIPNFRFAVHLAQSGKLGKLRTLHASCYTPHVRYDWLPAEREPARDVEDWDLWLGPAPWRPYNHTYVAGGWRGFFDFESGATLLDWGAHSVDLCQWANQADDTTPLVFEPSPSNVTATYSNGVKLVMDFLKNPFGDRTPHYRNPLGICPVRFEGEEGWVEAGDSGDFEVQPASLRSEARGVVRTDGHLARAEHSELPGLREDQGPHHAQFRRYASFAHRLPRRALAWMLGRKLTFDPASEAFIGDEEANRLRSLALREPWNA